MLKNKEEQSKLQTRFENTPFDPTASIQNNDNINVNQR